MIVRGVPRGPFVYFQRVLLNCAHPVLTALSSVFYCQRQNAAVPPLLIRYAPKNTPSVVMGNVVSSLPWSCHSRVAARLRLPRPRRFVSIPFLKRDIMALRMRQTEHSGTA